MNERVMTNDRERFIRFMRAMNTIDGEYAALMHGLRVKESLFVLLYACLDEAPRSQKEICDEWRMPRSTLNTAVLEEINAGNVTLVPCGHKEKLVTLTTKARDSRRGSPDRADRANGCLHRGTGKRGGEAKTAFSAVGKAPAPAEADVGSLNLESAR